MGGRDIDAKVLVAIIAASAGIAGPLTAAVVKSFEIQLQQQKHDADVQMTLFSHAISTSTSSESRASVLRYLSNHGAEDLREWARSEKERVDNEIALRAGLAELHLSIESLFRKFAVAHFAGNHDEAEEMKRAVSDAAHSARNVVRGLLEYDPSLADAINERCSRIADTCRETCIREIVDPGSNESALDSQTLSPPASSTTSRVRSRFASQLDLVYGATCTEACRLRSDACTTELDHASW